MLSFVLEFQFFPRPVLKKPGLKVLVNVFNDFIAFSLYSLPYPWALPLGGEGRPLRRPLPSLPPLISPRPKIHSGRHLLSWPDSVTNRKSEREWNFALSTVKQDAKRGDR